jgi:hypothetical protein
MAGMENETITEEQAMTMLWGTNGSGIASGTAYSKNSTGQYCWCKATNYQPTNGNKGSVGASRWVFYPETMSGDCAYGCALTCAGIINNEGFFRRAIFGQAQ